jgi:Tfp pilus assembly protein PilO
VRISRDNTVLVCILVGLAIAYALVVFRQQSNALAALRDRVSRTAVHVEQDDAKAHRVPAMKREIEQMRQRFTKDWDRRLPQSKELSGFLREIAANLAEARLANQIIQPGSPTKGSLFNCLPITMRFEGDFLSLGSFLARVGQMTRLTRIESMNIKPDQASGNLQIEISMNIYFTEQ